MAAAALRGGGPAARKACYCKGFSGHGCDSELRQAGPVRKLH